MSGPIITDAELSSAVQAALHEMREQAGTWQALFTAAGRAAEALANGNMRALKVHLEDVCSAENVLTNECEIFGYLADRLSDDDDLSASISAARISAGYLADRLSDDDDG